MKKHRISKHSYILKEEFLTPISKLLETSIKSICPASAILDMEIMELWSFLIKEKAPSNFQGLSYANRITKDRKLFIAVKTSVLANELQFMKKIFLDSLNEMILDLKKDTGKNYALIKEIIFELKG